MQRRAVLNPSASFTRKRTVPRGMLLPSRHLASSASLTCRAWRQPMSALGQKRTLRRARAMSALPPMRTFGLAVCAQPEGRESPSARSSDHENIAGKIEPPGEKLRNVMSASKRSASIIRPRPNVVNQMEESADQFRSWEEASQAGKKALKKLSENPVAHSPWNDF